MSTSYTVQINNITGKHTIQFETDDYDTLRRVEKECQSEIDRLNNEEKQTKMTPQEAVKYWKSFLKETHDIKTRNQFDEDLVQEKTNQKAATKLAISALEKQIPKKPLDFKSQEFRSSTTYRCRQCPNCGKKFAVGVSRYCYHCGQALDWSRE